MLHRGKICLMVNKIASFGSCGLTDEDKNFNARLMNRDIDLRDVIYLDSGVSLFLFPITRQQRAWIPEFCRLCFPILLKTMGILTQEPIFLVGARNLPLKRLENRLHPLLGHPQRKSFLLQVALLLGI